MTAIERAKEASLHRLAQKYNQQSDQYHRGDEDAETYTSRSRSERDGRSARGEYSRENLQHDGGERNALQRLIRQVLQKDATRQSDDGGEAYRNDAKDGRHRDDKREDIPMRGKERESRDQNRNAVGEGNMRGSNADQDRVRSEYRDGDARDKSDHRRGEGQGETGDRRDRNIQQEGNEGGGRRDHDDVTHNANADLIGLLKKLISQRTARRDNSGRHSERQAQSESESRGSDSSRDRESNDARKDARMEEGVQGHRLLDSKRSADGKTSIIRKMRA
jgi:hypothetical protein